MAAVDVPNKERCNGLMGHWFFKKRKGKLPTVPP